MTPRLRSCLLLPVFPGLLAGAVAAGGWGEPHLPILPRTAADRLQVQALTASPRDFTVPERFESRPAGAATRDTEGTRDAFSFPSANMTFGRELEFRSGNGFFRTHWVAAPTPTPTPATTLTPTLTPAPTPLPTLAAEHGNDGLGPLFNAPACQSCHVRDGRGHPPAGDADTNLSMFLRLSIPKDASRLDEETLRYLPAAPDPGYGTQLQNRSIAGHASEGQVRITHETVPVPMGDGSLVELRRPLYSVASPAYGPLHPQVQLSPRVAPQMIGLGLLEAVPEADILARADPADANRDGISGRPYRVWSTEFGQWMLGRFGLKAGEPTLRSQTAAAFRNDMGLSTSLHPDGWGDCTQAQVACRSAPDGRRGAEQAEVSPEVLNLVTFYSRNLAVPARSTVDDPTVLRGKALFHASGCASCHRPNFVTHRLDGQPEQSFQLIWPYTDLLLHDMGDGLADNRPEWAANGREWRTAPLWGLGWTQIVSGQRSFLHDGRALSLLEAILWHGGEAEAAREAVQIMPEPDRAALIAFLNAL